ncbi:MAG: MarR family winged helix-turn-helix transcriptional regulator [Streptosporangiaceae bacterium]
MDDAATPPGNAPAPDSDAPLAELAPLSHAIFRVARLHKTLAGQLLRQVGLYPNQELMMMRLWTQGPQRQVDLVRMLQSEAPTITRTIRRLEQAGLVRTSRSPTDRRSIIVEATPASMPLRNGVEQAWATLEAWTVGHWTESQRNDVLDALTALETNLLEAERRERTG